MWGCLVCVMTVNFVQEYLNFETMFFFTLLCSFGNKLNPVSDYFCFTNQYIVLTRIYFHMMAILFNSASYLSPYKTSIRPKVGKMFLNTF